MPEALRGRKGERSDVLSEVSGAAKDCTDGQELHKRHKRWDECAQQHEVLNDRHLLCRCSSGNPKAIHLTGGDLLVCLSERRSQQRP